LANSGEEQASQAAGVSGRLNAATAFTCAFIWVAESEAPKRDSLTQI